MPGFVRAEERTVTFSSLLKNTVDLETLYLPPEYRLTLFSSYSREGDNQDDTGYLRKEGDWYVIAEMQEPGAVTRIWSANPQGLIRIYIDNGSEPLIQVTFRELFSSELSPFVKPFVRDSIKSNDAYWSYIPIPYAKFCKITVSELCYYQIECVRFPYKTNVEPITMPFPNALDKEIVTIGNQFHASVKTPFQVGKQIKEYRYSHQLAAGKCIDLATFSGPAIIRGMKVMWPKNSRDAGEELLVRCYWDDETDPSVQVPIQDFFCSDVQSLVMGHEQKGWDYIYFPMPFKKNARINLDNGATRTTRQVSFILYVEEVEQLPDSLRTFHACWNRDNETAVPSIKLNPRNNEPVSDPHYDYTAFSTSSAGHLAGIRMSMTPSLESDVTLYIDRMLTPTLLRDSGNMGFFNMAWETQTVNWPLSGGNSRQQGPDTLLRLFLPSMIEYAQGARISIEHGSGNALRKDYSSTVYWYQEEPHTPYPWPLPPASRQNRTVPLVQPIFEWNQDQYVPQFPYEAEDMPVWVTGGIYDPQDMKPLGPDWSRNKQIRFESLHPGGKIRIQLPTQPFSGWQWLYFTLTSGPEGGITDVQINEQPVLSSLDLYDPAPTPKTFKTIEPVFIHVSDEPRIDFTVNGQNPKSSGTVVGIDTLHLIPTESVPESLQIQGPYAVPADSERSAPRTIQSIDGERLLLGYTLPLTDEDHAKDISPSGSTKLYDLGSLLSQASMNNGIYYLTWTVDIDWPGIYRFELKPAGTIPLLIREESGRMAVLKNRLLINGVILSGNDHPRYDPVENQIMPQRYRIPLQQGKNELSWLIQCATDTTIQPVLYGASKGEWN